MQLTTRSTWAKAAAIGLATAAASILGPVQTAAAGESCTLGMCSETVNQSSTWVVAYKNWTCSTGSTGTSSTGCVQTNDNTKIRTLAPWTQTPGGEDWDAFRVDAGYCFKVRFTTVYGSSSTKYYNRSGLGAVYVKVGNDATAYVLAQKYGACP
ncbi:hypothetical protein ABZ920_15480 [Streptomyces sp. NPDC046831]|uniref:hypothetical protein n=1 Tax=Streptomyces sp. NPDC046831 TaxID=3154805 RepID=UPI0033F93B48